MVSYVVKLRSSDTTYFRRRNLTTSKYKEEKQSSPERPTIVLCFWIAEREAYWVYDGMFWPVDY